MTLNVVSLIVWRGRVYMPTQVRAKSGFFVDIDPVSVIALDIDSLAEAIGEALQRGHPLIDDPDWRKQPDVLLNATGADDWETLAKYGASFQVRRTDDSIIISMDRLDPEGRWEPDPEKEHRLDIDTPMDVIASIILDGAQDYPAALKAG